MSHSEDEVDVDEENLVETRKSGQAAKFSEAFSKILTKRTAKESGLSRLDQRAEKAQRVEAKDEAEQQAASRRSREQRLALKRRGRNWPLPRGEDPEEDALQRRLLVTATRGVVQLFNAVRKAQKDIEEDNPTSKSSKAGFLAELKARSGGTAAVDPSARTALAMHPTTSTPASYPASASATPGDANPDSSWDVFRDDFLTGRNRLRDWDKEDTAQALDKQSEDDDDDSGDESDF